MLSNCFQNWTKQFSLFISFFCWASISVAEMVRVPGTSISMEPPSGFELTDQFTGFVGQEPDTSILVTTIPGPYFEIITAITESNSMGNGMHINELYDMNISGLNGKLVFVEQMVNGLSYSKVIAIFGDNQQTNLVAGTYRSEMKDRYQERVMLSFKTVQWDAEVQVNLMEGLPFSVDEISGFKIVDRINYTLMLSTVDTLPISVKDPILAVGLGQAPSEITDVEELSIALISGTASVSDINIVSTEVSDLDGEDAITLIATATDVETNTPMSIYQCITASGQYYLMARGLVSANKPNYLKDFEAIKNTIRLPR